MSTTIAKRVRGYLVSGEMLAGLIAAGCWTVEVKSDVPAGAKFLSAYFTPEFHAFVCILEHESFEEVGEGERVPIRGVPARIRPLGRG